MLAVISFGSVIEMGDLGKTINFKINLRFLEVKFYLRFRRNRAVLAWMASLRRPRWQSRAEKDHPNSELSEHLHRAKGGRLEGFISVDAIAAVTQFEFTADVEVGPHGDRAACPTKATRRRMTNVEVRILVVGAFDPQQLAIFY